MDKPTNDRTADNPGESLTIERFLALHYFAQRDLRSTTKHMYVCKVRKFNVALGRPARLGDFTDATINWYLSHRLETVKRETVRSDKACLISIWNAAYDERMVEEIPRRVKKIRREGRIVEGWTPEELGRLLRQCKNPPSCPRFALARERAIRFWCAAIRVGAETGLIFGDLRLIRFSQIRYPEQFEVIRSKIGKIARVAISEEAWKAVQELRAYTGAKPFDVMVGRKFSGDYKELAEAADVPRKFGARLSSEQLSRVLKEGENPPGERATGGCFQGKPVHRDTYWIAAVRFAYDTGLRLGDILHMRFDAVRYPDPFTIIQRKTGKPVTVSVREETYRALAELHRQAGCETMFGVISRHWFFIAFKELAKAAGVPGTFSRFLRRTSGSMVEAMQPGAGSKHLGHADPTVFDRHYNVRALTERPPMLPPMIPALSDSGLQGSTTLTNRPSPSVVQGATMKAPTKHGNGALASFTARGFKAIKRAPTMFLWRPGEKAARAIDGNGAWRKHRDETAPRWRTIELTVESREHFERIAAACYCGAPGVDRCDFCSGAREA